MNLGTFALLTILAFGAWVVYTERQAEIAGVVPESVF